ncbi:MAG: SulP family inorganic anion transporter [Rhodothermaceae bacterium]|nr:SulP family inorganic anion transporter [Rhodothermaceae bacterium]MXX59639.1 SulP family inorganic anion transporter [Rhodothermaceae bacterium]MYD19453.1 SulP family inorganic anion transporter [Rhodothermaceae bacterium]MYD56391.1 SulP family inorganic anion transporter [Rhodothermaceae bacterium]MYI43357.1 SulP family inorganic anion transporter [Rhodothermaceae bacterium]
MTKSGFSINYNLTALRGDFFGGLTGMVITLPVALGFGIASGMGAAAGLYSAIAVGFFAAVFGGTRAQISGPTAPMTVAMAAILTNHADSLAEALMIVVIAGVLQILLGVSRICRFVAYTPHAVIVGFMSGIGLVIVLMQSIPLLGAPATSGGPVGAMQALPTAIGSMNMSALVIGAITIATGFLWSSRFSRIIPGPLAALLVGTAVALIWQAEVPIVGAIPRGLPNLHIGEFSVDFLLFSIKPALVLALLGAIDSLLTSIVADSLTGSQHDPNKEMVGQGIGNMVAGLFGALPGAGTTMTTVTNIRSGGRTPVAGALCAVIILAVGLGLAPLVEPIPLAVVAGVLIKVGWDIVDWKILLRIPKLSRAYLAVMLSVLCLTVFVDLIMAVSIGLILGGMAHARKLERLELDNLKSVPILDRRLFKGIVDTENIDQLAARVGLVTLTGTLTFASSHKLVSVIGLDIKEHEAVVFDFSDVIHIDASAAAVFSQLLDIAAEAGTACIVTSLTDEVSSTLRNFDSLRRVPNDRVVSTVEMGMQLARECVGPPAPVAHSI